MKPATARIIKLARFSLTTTEALRAAAFYETALGCRRLSSERLRGPAFERRMGVRGGAHRITLSVGNETIELLQFDEPGASYPLPSPSNALLFQHLALVTADMGRAFARLSAVPGWTSITRKGPQRLPATSGGVTAFKFRDPEGHPLELISFPAGAHAEWAARSPGDVCLGIDHSAISVGNTVESVSFYERLGLTMSARSLNFGSEQNALDNIPGVRVEVTALAPPDPTPHLELLGYGAAVNTTSIRASNAVADTRLVFVADGVPVDTVVKRDPDGHAIMLTPESDDA